MRRQDHSKPAPAFCSGLLGVVLVLAVCVGAVAQPRAGLVRAGLPGEDPALTDALSERLASAGYELEELDAEALCQAERLSPEALDLLVLPNAAALPARSVPVVSSFLQQGGDVIALNAPVWQNLLIKPGDAWVTRDQYERTTAAELPGNLIYDFRADDIEGWQWSHFGSEEPTLFETVDEGPATGQRSLHALIGNLCNWDNFGPAQLEGPFPEGHTLTVFAAKGGPDTLALAVEWQEKDGARWIATVPLSREWRRYVLAPEDFKFWESVEARRHDVFRPENAARMTVGMAFTHTGHSAGRHEYWVANFGTEKVRPEFDHLTFNPRLTPMDVVCPSYKYFESTGVGQIAVRPDQAVMPAASLPVPKAVRSPQPRPNGGGFGKGRSWRWIPLMEVATPRGEWRGNPAALFVNVGGKARGGQWAGFGVDDTEWYRSPAALDGIEAVARRMVRPVYFVDAGADCYTYFEDQDVQLGATLVNLSAEARDGLVARVTLTNATSGERVAVKEWRLDLEPGGKAVVSEVFAPETWPAEGYAVAAELLDDGKVIDRVEHEIFVWRPKEKKSFMTVENGEFMLDGQRWRAHGVNYMPSSGIGIEDGPYFEHWIGARPYHPEVIQRDLDHCLDMGLNAVSIFIYHESVAAQNLLDLLRRLDAMGMKANLSMRPGTPLDFRWSEMQEIIQYYRLWEHDCVFAYDLAWEPLWLQQKDRKRWDKDWAAWIVERYGSIENAELDWAFPVPRDEAGDITNPAGNQVREDGEWRRMVAAYRRFLDTLLYKYYSKARALVRSVDPNHFVSFRMTEAGDPTMDWGEVLAYDFPYLAAAVDIIEPEGYGRIGDWERIKPGWFEYEYARWAAPHLPVMWAEAGVHAWDMGTMRSTQANLDNQGRFYRDFYRMLISSCADGIFWWWYPGGFRVGENSDYGILNADGSDRPNTKAIREHAEALIDGPSIRPVDRWFEVDRDAHTNGVVGIYDEVGDEFWEAIEAGHTPGLRTAGTGSTSADCPLLAVGNTPCDGTNPPKYLDAFFDRVEVRSAGGRWVAVDKGGEVDVDATQPVALRLAVTNLGEATWLAQGEGAVRVVVSGSPKGEMKIPLKKPVPHFGTVELDDVRLSEECVGEKCVVTLRLDAEGRTPFGEKFTVTLAPSR